MEVSPATPAAPAQPVADPTPTASEAAVAKSTIDYRAARRAERFGKPGPVAVEAVPAQSDAKPDPAAAAPAQPQLSRKEREQNDANERTRKAVEAATADIRAELERVKASAAPRSEPAAPATPAPAPAAVVEKFPSIEEWSTKNPDKGLEDYIDARAEFQQDQKTNVARLDADLKARAEDLTKRGQAFSTRMSEAIKAEPDLKSKIPPALSDPNRDTRPLSALSPQELQKATFVNLVAEAMFRSERPAEIAKYLHANQAETVRIAKLPTFEALLALSSIDGKLSATGAVKPAEPAKPKPKTITSAPAPQETLGSRPAESVDPLTAAVKSGDTRAYREQRRAERAQNLGRR